MSRAPTVGYPPRTEVPACHTDELSFIYDPADTRGPALQRVSLAIPKGSIFAVLGPNGSGKTTLFHLMLGLLSPTAGAVSILGGRPDDRRHQPEVAWVPAEFTQSMLVTVDEYLAGLGDAENTTFDEDFAQSLLAPFEMDGMGRYLLGGLSHGMRKKTQLIGAIAMRPRVLMLDEPFSGLDPQTQHLLEAAVRELGRAGTTVIMSSYKVEIVQYLATHLAILNRGELCAVGSVEELLGFEDVSSLRELYLGVTGVIADTAERAQHLRRIMDSPPATDRMHAVL